MFKQTLGACAIVACAAVGAAIAVAGETVDIVLDRATVTRIPDKVATIVVGNPLIADASLQPGGIMVLTGKGFGTTNVLALDRLRCGRGGHAHRDAHGLGPGRQVSRS